MEEDLTQRRTDTARADVVEESIELALSVGILAALKHLTDNGIPVHISERLLRGDIRHA